MGPRSTEDAHELFEYSIKHPIGWVIDDAMLDLGWDYHRVRGAIRNVRLILGSSDTVNLICNPQGGGERWRYHLVGSLDLAMPWIANRLGDLESRLETISAEARSYTRSSDGRTIQGRKARIIERALRHLLEDLRALEGDATL